MSEAKEMQEDEKEALISIYEGDGNFKQLSPTSYQYKYGEDDNNKSFLVELNWGENYPNDLPNINMDTFFNRNLISSVKEKIINALKEEANQWLGCGMTYTLFEYLKDHIEELTSDQPEKAERENVNDLLSNIKGITISTNEEQQPKAPKKEQLTKSQKRRQWERTDHKGDRERGWNWVDIVKHLSQTGAGKEKAGDNQSTSNILVT